MVSGGHIKAVPTGISTHSARSVSTEHCTPHISYNYLIILSKKNSSHKQMTYKMTLFKTTGQYVLIGFQQSGKSVFKLKLQL